MLVRELFSGPLDIVGDIHGELGSLEALLFRLGYDASGSHVEGRRLVFVGDLVDRGPDSPGVVRLVRSLVQRGAAQLILGNHEVNLLRQQRKHGNHWFWGEAEHLCNKAEAKHPVLAPGRPCFQVPLSDAAEREDMLAFFRTQPLVLEREGLRVVHAMWHQESVDALRNFQGDAGEAFQHFEAVINKRLATDLRDASEEERELAEQNENPVHVLTTGMEVPAKEPFFAGGKMRTLERHRWWEDYNGEAGMVVMGHYWRRLHGADDLGVALTGPPLFPPEEGGPALLGASRSVMCVDFSVGLRYEERGRGLLEGSLGTALAALRWPELSLHFADGRPTVNLR